MNEQIEAFQAGARVDFDVKGLLQIRKITVQLRDEFQRSLKNRLKGTGGMDVSADIHNGRREEERKDEGRQGSKNFGLPEEKKEEKGGQNELLEVLNL